MLAKRFKYHALSAFSQAARRIDGHIVGRERLHCILEDARAAVKAGRRYADVAHFIYGVAGGYE